MFQQRHNNINTSELDQMLHMLTSNSIPMPFPTTSMDKSNSKWKPNIEIAPNCPRCASTHTKFCYYNNYSLSQPRYFCKGCRRYWTKGGSLRNVPVGGGCRKTRRGKAVRNSQNSDRLSANGSVDDGDGNHQQNQNNGSCDIDMAVVFANFLNQNPNSITTTTTPPHHHGDEELEIESEPNNNNGLCSSSNNGNNLSTPDSVETENDAVVQSENPFDQELSLSGIEYDQFEGLLGVDEDVVQDVLWSESDAMNMMVSCSNNYTWQQPSTMMQMELEYSMPLNENCGIHHDQLLPVNVNSNSTNVNLISDQSWISNSWDSFDLSTMEVFSSSSRP
jgi:hypothetical protein